MIEDSIRDAESRMKKSVEALQNELSKLRTGRAHPSILAHVQVSYYGSNMPLSQVANVSISDARTLLVAPWEKNMVQPIEKAIIDSGLGLNPVTVGLSIRIPMPPLTEERRRDLSKVVKAEAEQARVAVRNVRRDANHACKDLLKEKKVTEDDNKRAEERIQKLTDQYIAKLDQLAQEKEKDLMAI
jgi:ribosome recycling factor